MPRRIGIPLAETRENVGVKTGYLYFIEDVKATPVIIQPQYFSQELYKLDGLLLPGGADVDSKRYEPFLPRWGCDRPDSYLEYFDKEILPNFISKDFPIFGICRGLQTLNVKFGGTLHRDISKIHPVSKDRYTLAHEIKFTGELSGGGWVNSFHHQAIKNLGKGIKILAVSNVGQYVEAICHEEFPIYAVQWHPERQYSDGWSRKIAKELFA